MAKYKLHYFPESGNSYKLALMLKLCGQHFDPVWTDFANGVTHTAAWRASVNEMGEIPVLEIDGAKFTQTAPILIRLARTYGKYGWQSEDEEAEILRWLFWDNHKLTSYMATYRFQRAFLPSAEPAVLEFLRKRIDDCLGILDQHIGQQAFVIGERATIADISMVGYLCFPNEESGFDIAMRYPAIAAWLARLGEMRGWQAPYDLLPGKRMPINKPLN